MENHEEPSVLRVITDYDAQDHGLDVMRDALNYQVGIQIINWLNFILSYHTLLKEFIYGA